jgi:ectoine hydroxylase-related dioxygenase (phytanoyl-CoA dioxygenase family)
MLNSVAELPISDCAVSALSYDQVYHFMEEGYVVVSGLIPKDVAARADEAAFRVVGIDINDPATWLTAKHSTFSEDPALMAMYTPAVRTAAAQLASTDPHMFSMSRVPTNAYILTVKTESNPEWKVQGPHIDGAGNWQNIVCSFPRPWTMFAMIYLHDVPRHCGNTVVFPKSHRKYQALLRSDPERYRFLAQMNDDFSRVDVGEPVELLAKAGDVAFLDQMMMHAGTVNCGKRPRFAMNMKW